MSGRHHSLNVRESQCSAIASLVTGLELREESGREHVLFSFCRVLGQFWAALFVLAPRDWPNPPLAAGAELVAPQEDVLLS